MPSCFVIMGYGEKTDLETGRKLNLDATYHNIIKPASEAAGYTCIRADEVLHSGVIDIPMYDMLFEADLVIADISTSNPNAMFELGVRHALRPRSTIIIAESQFKNPFDVNHISIRRYTHLGPDIGYTEAGRMQKDLEALIAAIATSERPDSPVYSVLGLEPPRRPTATRTSQPSIGVAEAQRGTEETHAALWAEVAAARAASDFEGERAILIRIRDKQTLRPGQHAQAARPRVVRELAFCTYKIGDKYLKSDPAAAAVAYEEAISLLRTLDPEQTTDPETLGLWSGVHKRRSDLPGRSANQRLVDLEIAIFSAERGFLIRQDYYTGINLAYLFDLRASLSSGDQKIADRVLADRVRKRVIKAAERAIKLTEQRLVAADGQPSASALDELYWANATIAEALIGLGDETGELAFEKAKTYVDVDWMIATTVDQIEKLKALRAI